MGGEDYSKKVNPVETGYGDGYQTSVDIESRTLFGMSADDVYRRQTGMVLDGIPDSLNSGGDLIETNSLGRGYKSEVDVQAKKWGKINEALSLGKRCKRAGIKLIDKFDLGLKPGKKVLDIASGEGDSSRYLATTGADVVSRDLSEKLVGEAVNKDAEIRSEVRDSLGYVLGDVNYDIGDMGDVATSLDSSHENFDAITCMGRSFIYLIEREKYEKAFSDYFDLLVPGGKLVLQGRQKVKDSEVLPWAEETQTVGFKNKDTDESIMRDLSSGIDFAWRKGTHKINEEGVKISEGSRYLRHSDGSTQELGETKSDGYFSLQHIDKIADMARKAGFVNIGLKAQELSRDGSEIMFALVAEKPSSEQVENMAGGFGRRLLDRLPFGRNK